MRTYSRKRPAAHQMIEGVHELCRLCLKRNEETMPIFTDDSGNMCAALALRIMICVGLEMSNEECLPNIVCSTCYKELEQYYSFRKMCEASYHKLKSHMLAVQTNELRKELDAMGEPCVRSSQKEKEQDDLNVQKRNHLVFMVNSDGTVKLCEEGPSLDKEESLVSVTNLANTVPNLEPNVHQSEETVLKSAPIIHSNIIIHSGDLVIDSTVPDSCKIDEIVKTHSESEKAIVLSSDIQMESEPKLIDQDLSKFLSDILVEYGILSRQGECLAVLSTATRTLELETGDGSLLTLELMEEDGEGSKQSLLRPKELTVKACEENKQAVPVIQSLTPKLEPVQHARAEDATWCSTCGRGFASRGARARHERDVHARARPHACRVCARRFAQKEVLARHQLVHEVNRPFQCAACPKSFTQRGALETHARSHVPPQARALELYRCARCPKVFLYASGLSRHAMAHEGRRYACGGCARLFQDKSSLRRHLRNTGHAAADT